MEAQDLASEAFSQAIQYVRSVERLRAAIASIGYANEALRDVAGVDADLAPELTAAIENLAAALEALGRGAEFLDARLETRIAAAIAAFEGGEGE